jgi:hypothetical protein
MTIKLEPGENLLNIKLKPIPPKLDDLDLSLLKMVSSSLEGLRVTERDRVLGTLNFLYDALAAPTGGQSYVSIYGGLSYLMSSVGREGRSLNTASETFSNFTVSGLLSEKEESSWMNKFRQIHTEQYKVIKSSAVKKEKLDEIKAFFKKFLAKYIEYGKVRCQQE